MDKKYLLHSDMTDKIDSIKRAIQSGKTVILKDGRECVLRNGTADDAKAALDLFLLTHAQTDFLASYPEESTHTLEGEAEFLETQAASERNIELLAEIDGIAVGLAGILYGRAKA